MHRKATGLSESARFNPPATAWDPSPDDGDKTIVSPAPTPSELTELRWLMAKGLSQNGGDVLTTTHTARRLSQISSQSPGFQKLEPEALQYALEQLRQTRSLRYLAEALKDNDVARQFVQETATLQCLQKEGESLLQTLQRKGVSPSTVASLRRNLQQLLGSGNGQQTTPFVNFSQSLQQLLQQLLSLSHDPALQGTSTLKPDQASVSQTRSSDTINTDAQDVDKQSKSTETTETKKREKTIWEKIADFFKKLFQVLFKIFDFLSPLLNLIPGLGPAIFAAYQGVKLIVSLVKGDVGGVIGSLASMAGGIGGAVGGVAGSILNVASKATQAGHALAQAIESKNPLAILGALGSVSGSLGQIGKTLGKLGQGAAQVGQGLTQAMKYTQQGLRVATAGATFINGAAQGNPDRALAGLTGMLGASSAWTGGTTQQLMQHASQGVNAIQNLAQGRYNQALQGFANTLTPLSQLPEARDILDYVQAGLRTVGDLTSGDVGHASQRLLQQISAHNTGEPAIEQAKQHLLPALQFLTSLTRPQTGQHLGQMAGSWQRVQQQPDFQRAMQWCQQFGQSLGQLPSHQPERILTQMKLLTAVQQYQQAHDTGRLAQGVDAYCQQLQAHLTHPSVAWTTQWLQQGQQALHSLLSGQAQASLQALKQQPDFAQNADLSGMQETLQQSQRFLQGLVSNDLGMMLGQLQQQTPDLLHNEAYLTFLQQTADLAAFLQPIHQGQAHQRLTQTNQTLQTHVTPERLKDLLMNTDATFSG